MVPGNPFRTTAVPFWGQTTWNLTGLSPKRDGGSKRVNTLCSLFGHPTTFQLCKLRDTYYTSVARVLYYVSLFIDRQQYLYWHGTKQKRSGEIEISSYASESTDGFAYRRGTWTHSIPGTRYIQQHECY